MLTWQSITQLPLDKYKLIHFEGLRNPDQIAKMIRYIRQQDTKREIVITLELEKNWKELKGLFAEDIDIFFIESEFAKVIMNFDDSQQTVEGVSRLVHPKALVICPWGETGAKAIDNQNKQFVYSSPVFPPKDGVVDTLGAGDTFLSATLFALYILDYNLQNAIEFGCRVAGAKCAKFGYKHINQFDSYI